MPIFGGGGATDVGFRGAEGFGYATAIRTRDLGWCEAEKEAWLNLNGQLDSPRSGICLARAEAGLGIPVAFCIELLANVG